MPPGSSGPGSPAPVWLVRGFIGANVLAVVLISTLTVTSLVNSRQAQLDRANATAANITQTLRQSFESEIDQIDLLLRAAILGLDTGPAGGGDPAELRKLMQGSRSLLPHLEALRVTDEHGNVRSSDGTEPPQPLYVGVPRVFPQGAGEPLEPDRLGAGREPREPELGRRLRPAH